MMSTESALSAESSAAQHSLVRAGWLLLSFFGGLQIMLLEVAGFRVLQTNLGSSVWVTGTLLTVIMAVLSAGYYLGGVLSHRADSTRTLLVLLLCSVAYTYVVDSLYLESMADFGYALRERFGRHPFMQAGLPAAVLSLVLYGPPVLVMSMISPFLIRLETDRTGPAEARTGKQSGFFMSLSTAGSIAGTLLASYLFIPLWGVRTTVAISSFAFLLLPVALLLSERRGRWEVPAVALLLVLAATSLLVAVRAKPNAEVLYDTESFYGNIRVVSETDEAGRLRLSYRPSRVYTHSVLYPDEPLRELVGSLYLLPALIEPPRNILVLGSAAGGVLRQAEELFPQATVVGVDLDPSVHVAAVRAFGVDPEKARLVASDARSYLATHEELFDFIIVDLFAGEFVPSHCITEPFFALVKRRLRPGGALFVNTNMNDVPIEFAKDEPFRAFRHLVSTLEAAGFPSLFENLHFHSLYAFPRKLSFAEFQTQVRGLRQRRALPAAARAAAGLALRTTVPAASFRSRYRPFSDEWAPEMLIELKSNKEALFEQFAELSGAERSRAVRDDHPVAHQSLAKLLEQGVRDGDFWSLSGPESVIGALNQLDRPLRAGDADLAARYLRFGVSEQSRVRAETPWAKVSELYARMSTQAYGNDYEALLETLAQLDTAFGDPTPL